MKSPIKNGLKFEKEIGESLKEKFQYVYKFPDFRGFHGYLKGLKFVPHPAPCDYFCIDDTIPYMIECKQTGRTALDFKAIKPHQLLNLELAKKAGAVSWFIVNFRTDLRMKEFRNECYVVDATKMSWAINKFENEGKKSIPIQWFRDNGTKAERINGAWKL